MGQNPAKGPPRVRFACLAPDSRLSASDWALVSVGLSASSSAGSCPPPRVQLFSVFGRPDRGCAGRLRQAATGVGDDFSSRAAALVHTDGPERGAGRTERCGASEGGSFWTRLRRDGVGLHAGRPPGARPLHPAGRVVRARVKQWQEQWLLPRRGRRPRVGTGRTRCVASLWQCCRRGLGSLTGQAGTAANRRPPRVRRPWFDRTVLVLIVANCVVMASKVSHGGGLEPCA